MIKKMVWALALIPALGFGFEAGASAPVITYIDEPYCDVFPSETEVAYYAQGTGFSINWTGGRSVFVDDGFQSRWYQDTDDTAHMGQFSANHVQVTQGPWTLDAFYRSDLNSWVSYELYAPSQLAQVVLYGATISNANTGQNASFDYLLFEVDSTTGAIRGSVQVGSTKLAILFREFQLVYDSGTCGEVPQVPQVDTHLDAFLVPQK